MSGPQTSTDINKVCVRIIDKNGYCIMRTDIIEIWMWWWWWWWYRWWWLWCCGGDDDDDDDDDCGVVVVVVMTTMMMMMMMMMMIVVLWWWWWWRWWWWWWWWLWCCCAGDGDDDDDKLWWVLGECLCGSMSDVRKKRVLCVFLKLKEKTNVFANWTDQLICKLSRYTIRNIIILSIHFKSKTVKKWQIDQTLGF